MSRKKIGVGVATFIGIIILGGAMWQRENIKALWEATQYTQGQLEEQITTTKEEVRLALEGYDLYGMRDLTLEEEAQMRRGELSVEEAIGRMTPQVSLLKDSETSILQDETDKKQQEAKVVATYSTKLYALKAKYLGLLGGLERRGRQALASIPSEERTLSRLKKVGVPFVQEAVGLESQCNGEVEDLLKNLKQELTYLDADTAIVETMRQAYHVEKRLKKAYYLSLVP